jgi:hypothetical protein
MITPPIVTTDFLYTRFIGGRSIDKKDFGRIQNDRVLKMKKWADEISEEESGKGKVEKTKSSLMEG